MRVAIYARVSTDKQDPEIQLADLRQYVRCRNFEIVDSYVDIVTGNIDKRNLKKARTEYDRLMRDAEAGRFDCVVVWKYDRFARSLIHLILALQKFNRLGVNFISASQEVDTTTPHGKLFFHMIASFAEFERGIISERTKAGLRLAASQGVRLGAKEEVTQPQKDRIIRRYTNHATINAIAKAEKMPMSTVYSILKRSICRLPCQHGKHRCKSCRKSSGVPIRSVTSQNERALG
jgi:DNA invertase Pin-like site-specific DNA recombinase